MRKVLLETSDEYMAIIEAMNILEKAGIKLVTYRIGVAIGDKEYEMVDKESNTSVMEFPYPLEFKCVREE